MYYCTKCGKKVIRGDMYCRNCGAIVNQSAIEARTPLPEEQKEVIQIPGDASRNWRAILSAVFGVIGLLSSFYIYPGFFFGVLALIFGLTGRKSQKKEISKWGWILGLAAVLLSAGIGIYHVYYPLPYNVYF